MSNPIGTWKAGEIVNAIRIRLRNLSGEVETSVIDKKYPKKYILRELNLALPEIQEYGGTKDAIEQSDYYTTNSDLDELNITTFTDYQNIDKITHIESANDSTPVTHTPVIPVTETEFANLRHSMNTSNYVDSIIWYRKGDILYFAKGSGVEDYATRVIFFTRIPQKAITYDSLLDIRDTGVNKVIARVIRNVTGQSMAAGNDELNNQTASKNADNEERVKDKIKS